MTLRLRRPAAPAAPAHWSAAELMAKTGDDLLALSAAYMRTHAGVARMLETMSDALTTPGRRYTLALAVCEELNAGLQ